MPHWTPQAKVASITGMMYSTLGETSGIIFREISLSVWVLGGSGQTGMGGPGDLVQRESMSRTSCGARKTA